MIDFGFDKIALIGAVALIVIGPERLPRVARTVGHLLGKAQRYVADVKAEVSRSIELEELKKAKSQFEDAARGMQESVTNEIHQVSQSLSTAWNDPASDGTAMDGFRPNSYYHKPKKKNWRLKRSAMPQWYKQRHGVRSKVQSGAARVARFRPPRPQA
jgi:sec-independent protein translocase protein TatB